MTEPAPSIAGKCPRWFCGGRFSVPQPPQQDVTFHLCERCKRQFALHNGKAFTMASFYDRFMLDAERGLVLRP